VTWGYVNPCGFVINCIISYVLYGSSYHFWFFPALIYAICFATVLWRLKKGRIIIPLSIILYAIGVIGSAYYNVSKYFPVLGPFFTHSSFNTVRRIMLMGFPFFSGGYLVLKIKDKFRVYQSMILWMVSLAVWIIEIVIVVKRDFQQSIVLTYGLYPLVILTFIVLLQNLVTGLKGIADICRKLANFTYYVHPAIIMLINLVFRETVSNTMMFILTVIVTFFSGVLLCRVNEPMLSRWIN
jgi:hypothetical protein